MKHILYLASKSASRKKLLERAGIAFEIIGQDADESQCDWSQDLQSVVQNIAMHKMNHIIMPAGKEGQIAFVLTADTLSVDTTGAIRGKPADEQEALMMLENASGPDNRCGTALCIEKKVFENGEWHTHRRIVKYAQASYDFYIPHEYRKKYLYDTGAMEAAGAIKIEDVPQFVRSINGSYTAIVGLPMFELWQGLQEMGFFN